MRVIKFWLVRALMVAFGIVLAFGLLEVMFRLFPSLRASDRANSVDMGVVQFTAGIGDMFIHRPGKIAPPADPYAVLSEHHLQWDADGFRVPATPAPDYPVITLGDSYTEAANVSLPWADVLAKDSGLAVRNLGFRGYGPAEEARILRDYGLKYNPRIIILGFFEGNDLYDVAASAWNNDFILPSLLRQKIEPFDPNARVWESDNKGPFQYPVTIEINGAKHDMVFFDTYISLLNATKETYQQSSNLDLFKKALADMQQSAGSNCFYFAYFPDKAHILMPYVAAADRPRVMLDLKQQTVGKAGEYMTEQPATQSYDEILARLDNQRDVIKQVVESTGIPFIDLLPAFTEATARGDILYYTYDTHWNQAGHDLAGRVIADYLAAHASACLE
ncbi:MAG: GDSL-type esterase/lipase family protein [Anaerolineae bacterium]